MESNKLGLLLNVGNYDTQNKMAKILVCTAFVRIGSVMRQVRINQ